MSLLDTKQKLESLIKTAIFFHSAIIILENDDKVIRFYGYGGIETPSRKADYLCAEILKMKDNIVHSSGITDFDIEIIRSAIKSNPESEKYDILMDTEMTILRWVYKHSLDL